MLEEWTALTIVTFAPFSISEPPLPKPTVSQRSLAFIHSDTSWMQWTLIPSFPASRAASEGMSPWAWVRRIWVAPEIASSSRPAGKGGSGQQGVDEKGPRIRFRCECRNGKPGDLAWNAPFMLSSEAVNHPEARGDDNAGAVDAYCERTSAAYWPSR